MTTMPTDRVILHCDCNNFYASVELLPYPELVGQPVAVAGDPENRHGIILAKNSVAKSRGVKTAETIWQALQKCPDLVLLPPHHDVYSEYSQRVNSIYLDVTDQVEPFSLDESWLDVTNSQQLFGDGVTIANLLRRRIKEELGLTISVGVSDNKTWAKMGSDFRKPDATTLISRDNVEQTLWQLPVSELVFVGRTAREALRHHGISTIGMLAACQPSMLTKFLGKQGGMLWRMANGMDDSPVRPWGDREPVKSISNSTTFPHDLVGREEFHAGLLYLCESVGARLRAQRLKCRTVTVQVKSTALQVVSRQKALPSPTSLTRQLYRESCAMMDEFWPEDAPVRLISVAASTLCPEDDAQSSQLAFLSELSPDDARQARLERAIDQIRHRYGPHCVLPGTPEIRAKSASDLVDTSADGEA